MNDLDPAQRSDQELAAALAAGDPSAIGEVAARYGTDLYDFAIRITLDAAAAAGVLQDTLQYAHSDATGRSQFLGLHAWLLALVRDNSLEALRQRGRADAEPDEAPTPISTNDPMFVRAEAGSDPELAEWAWQAARAQRPRDYSLLDLALRRQVASEEIAELAGLSRTGIYGVTGRLRGAFEEAFAATTLFYRGRDACGELDSLIGQNADLTPALRRDIAHHAESCPNCRLTLNSLPLASDLFAALDNVEMPGELSAHIEALFSRDAMADTIRGADALREQEDEAAMQTLDLDTQAATTQSGLVAGAAAGIAASGLVNDDEPPELVMDEDDQFESDEEPEDFEDEPEPVAASALDEPARRPVPLRFTRGPGNTPPQQDRIRFDRQDMYDNDGGGNGIAALLNTATGGRGVWFLALLLGIILIAGYVGVAVGDSLSGGGDDSKGVSALPTRAGGGRALACGSGPLTVDQGSSATLSLDPKALNGYQVTGVTVAAVSPSANAQSVVAKTQGSTNVVFEALSAPGQAGRADEYKLSLTLTRGNERIISDCTVVVRAPLPGTVVANPTRPATSTTPGTQTSGTPAAGTATPVRTPPPPGSTATRVP